MNRQRAAERRRGARYLMTNAEACLNVIFDSAALTHCFFAGAYTIDADSFDPANRPEETAPVTLNILGFLAVPVRVTAAIDDFAFEFQVRLSFPFAVFVDPAESVVQLAAFASLAENVPVAAVTPPPKQPPTLKLFAVIVDTTLPLLDSFGNGGASVAAPETVPHDVPPAANALDSSIETGITIAPIKSAAASLRIVTVSP